MLPFILAKIDVGTVIGIFLTLVVPIILVVSQIIAAMKNPQQQADGKPLGQGGGRLPNQPKPQRAEALSDEIDKFLRRMANPGAREEIADVEVLEPHEVERVPLAQEMAQRKPFAPVEAVPVEQPASQSVFSGSVTSHVDQHIGGSSFAQQVSRLGSVTGQADERVEERLQDTFDHRVGSLAKDTVFHQEHLEDTSIQAAELAPLSPHDYDADPASQSLGQSLSVGALLASPEGIRNAIILNEILRRPDERW